MLTLNKMIRKLSVKYSYINLTKGVKDYHTENHVTFLKEFKEDSGNGNTSHVHGWEDNTVTMSVLPRVVHRFSEFPIKIPTFLPSEKEKIHSELVFTSQNNLEKELQRWKFHISGFRHLLYCKTVVLA